MQISRHWRQQEWRLGLRPRYSQEMYWQFRADQAQRLATAQLQLLIVLVLGNVYESGPSHFGK